MFHLFRNIYLDFDFNYQLENSSEVYTKKTLNFNNQILNFESFESKFQNQVEDFWKSILLKKSSTLYKVFLEQDCVYLLQLELWKSLFLNLELDTAYFLHKSFIQNLKMNYLFSSKRNKDSITDSYLNLEFLDKEKFKVLFNKAQQRECLSQIDKTDLSYEYLIADYFSEQSITHPVVKKIEALTWRVVIQEIKLMREDFALMMYNKFKVRSVEDLDELYYKAKLEPSLLWLNDSQIETSNKEYIKEAYSLDEFLGWDKLFNPEKNTSSFEISNAMLFEKAFNDDYISLFLTDVKRDMGSVFVIGEDKLKFNNLFISYLYHLIRNDLKNELVKFKLVL